MSDTADERGILLLVQETLVPLWVYEALVLPRRAYSAVHHLAHAQRAVDNRGWDGCVWVLRVLGQ